MTRAPSSDELRAIYGTHRGGGRPRPMTRAAFDSWDNADLDEKVITLDRVREGAALPFLDLAAWEGQPVPEREWAVQDRIPLRQPTLFSGDGAAGKSTILLQQAAAHVLARDWLGMLPEPGPAIYFGAED